MHTSVRFDCFEVDFDSGELFKHGLRVKLRDQSFQVLALLLRHPGELVAREVLRDTLWPNGVFVDFDNNLNIVVARLREALGDSAEHPRFIETLPKRGYRFIGHLNPEQPHSGQPRTHDVVALHEYTQGRAILFASPETYIMAKQHLERAIARDPEFVDAHDALAELHWLSAYFGQERPRKAFAAGIAHALRALEIDNQRAETHALLAQFHKTIEYNWPEVHREMAIALALDPASPLVRLRYAVSELMPNGQLNEAIEQLELALESNPLSIITRMWLGVLWILSRDANRALEEGQTLLELDPNYPLAHFILGVSYRYLGQHEDSIRELRASVSLSGQISSLMGWLGMALALSGNKPEAASILERLLAASTTTWVSPTAIAWIYLGLGNLDCAFAWLDRAVDECDQLLMPIKSYAFMDPIRSDPRFARLLQKMHLQPELCLS